jgi:hypothetical protein
MHPAEGTPGSLSGERSLRRYTAGQKRCTDPCSDLQVATSLHPRSEALFALDSGKSDTPSDQPCSDVATFPRKRRAGAATRPVDNHPPDVLGVDAEVAPGEWKSHLDRNAWPPDVLAEVEAAEARMRAAVNDRRRRPDPLTGDRPAADPRDHHRAGRPLPRTETHDQEGPCNDKTTPPAVTPRAEDSAR